MAPGHGDGGHHAAPPTLAVKEEGVTAATSAEADSQQSLPLKPMLALALCNAAHFYSICSIFSYAGIMVVDLGWVPDRDSAGGAAGFLQSANVLGRIPTSSLWGVFADRFGSERALMVSNLSIAIGGLAFGFCTSWDAAVVARSVFLGAGNGWVTIFGPLAAEIGGADRQVEVTGRVFAAGTLVQLLGPAIGGWTYGASRRFPGVVPSLFGAGLALFAMLAMRFWMPTRPRRGSTPPAEAAAAPVEEAAGAAEEEASAAGGGGGDSAWSVLRAWPMPLLIALRSSQGFANFAFFEVVPLWAISSRSVGGLALSERDLGTLLAVSAVFSSLFLLFAMPRLTKRFGLRRSTAAGNAVVAFSMATMPQLTRPGALAVFHCATTCSLTMLAASYIACCNNAVPVGRRSMVNGVCVTFESLAKGVGPLSTSVAFAWTLHHWGFRGHGAVFFFLCTLHCLLCLGSLVLPADVEAGGGARAAGFEKAKVSPVAAAGPPARLIGFAGTKGRSAGMHYRAAATAERSGCLAVPEEEEEEEPAEDGEGAEKRFVFRGRPAEAVVDEESPSARAAAASEAPETATTATPSAAGGSSEDEAVLPQQRHGGA